MPTAERALLHRGGKSGTWGSLGLWHDEAIDYATACEALARAVGLAAGVQPGHRVLSIGCGAGDELLLWARGFGAAEVWGLEHDPLLLRAAEKRLATARLPDGCQVHLLAADATRLASAGLPEAHFDHVLCVDAAYHFSPRSEWLRAVRRLLAPGGRLAYTDLSLAPPAAGQRGAGWAWLLKRAAAAAGVDLRELLPLPQQRVRAQSCGYADVQVLALDATVLDGFAEHVRQQGPRVARTGWHPDWRRVALTARLVKPCRAAGLGYALISARADATAPGADGSGAATTPAAASMAAAAANAEATALSSKGTPASA